MRIVVTGCAGFIGSTLVDRLLLEGHEVLGIDNFTTGKKQFLHDALLNPRFTLSTTDILDIKALKRLIKGSEFVYHLSANADVRFGTLHPKKDLEQNTLVTYNVLEAMRFNGVKKIVFSSTGSVYGESLVIPTPEDGPFPIQTSLYGASKVACEGLISAYCEGFHFQAWIFRFVSILGERYTHGHVYDFYNQLKSNPGFLKVLGDGRQRKSYLHVQDCISAILLATEAPSSNVNIFNLGLNEYCEVNDSIKWICEELGVSPEIQYSGGDRGWVGDNPFIFLDTSKILSLGWAPKLSIRESIINTVQYLRENEWVLPSISKL